MRVVQIPANRRPPKRRRRWKIPTLALCCLLVGVLVLNYLRPLPDATITIKTPPLPTASTVQLAWPAFGQSSVAVQGHGIVAVHGAQSPYATASIAKIITALVVLEKYPLEPGQQGPNITLDNVDVALYDQQVQQGGSRLYVEPGEQLSEYQAFEAMLLPSANNIADSLARWAYGSFDQYKAAANEYLLQQGLSATTIGADASGFDAGTTSTATDLAKLGLIVARTPVLKTIAAQPETTLPLVGTVKNYNTALSGGFITGTKTGNNAQDPGAFLFAATPVIGGQQLYITGAVMGAPNLQIALDAGETLARSAASGFEPYTYLKAGSEVGTLQTPWGARETVTAKQTVRMVRWKQDIIRKTQTVESMTGTAGTTVGHLTLTAGTSSASTDMVIREPVAGPSFWWRLTRVP